MKIEPLFIRFANSQIDTLGVVTSIISPDLNEYSKGIAERAKLNLPDLGVFRRDFKKALEDLIDNGPNQMFRNYVDSYMKPSLVEFLDRGGDNRVSERRWVNIKAEDAPWVEALLCYNTCLYIKMYGTKELKLCPICSKFFSNKGKYAKYCSEGCKAQGKK